MVLHDQRSIWILTGNLSVTLLLVVLVWWKRRDHARRIVPVTVLAVLFVVIGAPLHNGWAC